MPVDVGQAAPDFSLYDTDRQQRTLSEFKGQNVVIAFFPGAFTGVCTTEMCTLRDSLSQFNSMNAQVIGISVDGAMVQKAFSDQNNLGFTVLSDFQRQAVGLYDVSLPNFAGMEGYVAAQRSVFVVDKEGIVRYKWVADSPGNEPNYEEVQRAVGQLS